eukprot:103003_1
MPYGEQALSVSISIDNISVLIVKSASKPYLIQLTSTAPHLSPNDTQNALQPISFFYDDDEAFNTVELWDTPYRHRRRLRTCKGRKRWGKKYKYWCPPIPPPNDNTYWKARYSKPPGRFIGCYPGKKRRYRYNWWGCAWHCSLWFGGLASIHSAHEQHQAETACNNVLIEPKPTPWEKYGDATGWREQPMRKSRKRRWKRKLKAKEKWQGWRSHSCFIGLHRPFKEWNDRRPISFTNWRPGQPDNARRRLRSRKRRRIKRSQKGHDANCVELVSNLEGWKGKWNDINCKKPKRPCLCQKPRGIILGHYVGVQSLWPYHKASDYCKIHYGTELATIASDEDQTIAKKLCMKICLKNTRWCQCWIGLQRPHHEWDDGTDAEEGFTNWNQGQPDNWRKSEGCTELVAKGWSGRWNDLHCGKRRYLLCNLQSRVERMDFNDREEMIAKRITRHKTRWERFQAQERRKKVRKQFFEQMRQKQAIRRKEIREKQRKMREDYRQNAFTKAMSEYGGKSAFGAESVFYGDVYEKRRRLSQWIKGNSRRMNELKLEERKHKQKRVIKRRRMKAFDLERSIDADELFYVESTLTCDDTRCVFVAADALREAMEGKEEEELSTCDEQCVFEEADALREEIEGNSSVVVDELFYDEANEGPRRCVFVAADALYELCLNDLSISMSKYGEKVLKQSARVVARGDDDMLRPNASEYDTMQFDELERFRYREAMDYDEKETRDLSMQIHKVNDVQFLKVIEFIFDHEKNHKKQCSTDEEDKYEMCLEFKEIENQMLVFVKKARGYLRDEGQWMSFEKDDEWDEVNVIYNGIRQTEEEERNVEKIKKCVTYLEHKVCVIQMMNTEIEGGIEDEYRVILIKLKKRMDDDDDVGREEDHFSQEYYDSFDF